MNRDDFWTTVRSKGEAQDIAAVGALRAALVFGAVVIAVAILVTPLLASREGMLRADRHAAFDRITTGTIPSPAERTYTIRRSITQPLPDALCIIDSDGSRRGAC